MPIEAKPVYYNGIRYSSHGALARAMHISNVVLSQRIANGKIEVSYEPGK